MSTFKTEAIILAKRPLKGADRLYIMYTKDHGKVEAKVRSAASCKSKLAGQVEPIVLTRVMIARGKGFDTIAGAQLVRTFLFNDQAFGALAAELIIKFIKPGVADVRIFDLLLSYFKAAEQDNLPAEKIKILTLRFIWQFLSLLGYQIDTNGHSYGELPALSQASRDLLDGCLKQKSQLTILKTSTKVVNEVAVFTQNCLRYFLEGDLQSYKFSFYPSALSSGNHQTRP